MPAPLCQLLHRTTVLFKVLYYQIKNVFCIFLFVFQALFVWKVLHTYYSTVLYSRWCQFGFQAVCWTQNKLDLQRCSRNVGDLLYFPPFLFCFCFLFWLPLHPLFVLLSLSLPLLSLSLCLHNNILSVLVPSLVQSWAFEQRWTFLKAACLAWWSSYAEGSQCKILEAVWLILLPLLFCFCFFQKKKEGRITFDTMDFVAESVCIESSDLLL